LTGAQAGILMLTGRLGNGSVDPLTPKQFHALRHRMAEAVLSQELAGKELETADIRRLGLPEEMAEQMLALLSREQELSDYLSRGSKYGIIPITRLHEEFPKKLEKILGDTAPAALYCKGDVSLLGTKCVALVGSRKLDGLSRAFAQKVGELAAKEGFTLVSGDAVGADSEAQEACLKNGGRVVVFTPETLARLPLRERVLYCSEDGFDEGFSAQRALSRNRLIHAMGEKTFVARCTPHKGGTWHGTIENLRNRYSPVFVFGDGSAGADALLRQGAAEIGMPKSLLKTEDGQKKLF